MPRQEGHCPTIYESMWLKIAEVAGIDPADSKKMSIFIREEMLAKALFYWPRFRALDQATPLPMAPPLPAPPPMPSMYEPDPPQPLFAPPPLPMAPPPVYGVPPAFGQWGNVVAGTPDAQSVRWKPAEYEPPAGEDPGRDIVLEWGPEICWQCRPKQEIKLGESANMRTGRYGKEYRHSWHCHPMLVE